MTMCCTTDTTSKEGTVTISITEYNRLRDELRWKNEAIVKMQAGRPYRIDRYAQRYFFATEDSWFAELKRLNEENNETDARLDFWTGKINAHNKLPWWRRFRKITSL